jgi:hypothetical protein
MEAEKKARELYYKMLDWVYNGNKYIERNIVSTAAKQCALIAVDEILDLHKKVALETLEFYLEVKQEIEKL